MLKADFHIHTHYSKCSEMTPREAVRTAIAKGYDVLGIVDHNNVKGGLEARRIADKKILVIPGEEIKTNHGEVIVFLSDGKYSRDLIEVCERAKDMNHFIVAPHPFDFFRILTSLRKNILKIEDYLDAVEIFNSRTIINRFNELAGKYALENRISRIAGSDAHFVEEIGNVTVSLNCERNVGSVFDCIKKGNIKFEGRKCSPYYHFKTNVILPIKRLF